MKCGFPLAGTRRIAPRKIAPGELPNPNPPGAILMGAIFQGQFVEGSFPGGRGGFSCHAFGHHHIENVCVLGERESSSHQNHKRGQVKSRSREGECGKRIARKIRVLTRENFAICVFIIKGISPVGNKSRDGFLRGNFFSDIGRLEPIILITGKHHGEK